MNADDGFTDKTNLYIDRINRVMDYVEANLGSKLALDELAGIACLSKYHFHRVFSSFTHESLYSFVNRLRLEKAAALLVDRARNITDVAFDCGFNDSATFSRAFRKRFGIPAQKWRKVKDSNIRQAGVARLEYDDVMGMVDRMAPLSVAIRDLGAMKLAYVRHSGRFSGDARLFRGLHERLMSWAGPRGLDRAPGAREIIVYHDPLGITDDSRLRLSLGITVPDGIRGTGAVGTMPIPGGLYIVCAFMLAPDDYGRAWTRVYREEIPQRGLQPEDGVCFESYAPDCHEGTDGSVFAEICVPVKSMEGKNDEHHFD